jgi:hypothetical protein
MVSREDRKVDMEGFTCVDVCGQVRKRGVVQEFVDG